jgi:hypothetical protein
MGLAVLAGLGLSVAASSANAALITFEARPTSATTVANPGDVVTFDIYAVVANGDSNRTNDGFNIMHTALTSVDSGVLGNLSPVTYDSTNIDAATSAAGTPTNLDANPDLEVGSLDPAVQAGWVVLSTGTSAKFGTGTTGNPEFRLGSSTWTYTGGTGSTNLNVALRLRTTGLASLQQTVKYTSDGVAHSERSDNANIAVGAPIVVNVVPEPAALGLLGLGGLAALRRRRA